MAKFKIKKFNKYIKMFLILLFGVEYSTPVKVSLAQINNVKLKELLREDEFGVYKKLTAKIPFKFRRVYKKYKRCREELVYVKYYKLNASAKYGFRKRYYLYDSVENISNSDKMVIQELLNKG